MVTTDTESDEENKVQAQSPESNDMYSLEEPSTENIIPKAQLKDMTSDSLAITADNEGDKHESFLNDLDSASDTGPVSLSQDQETEAKKTVQNEVIMVADLEKSFFSSKLEFPKDFVQPEKSEEEDHKVYLNIRRKSGLSRPRTADCGRRTHELSRRGHLRSGGDKDRGIRQRSVSYSGSEHTSYESTHSHKQPGSCQTSSTTATATHRPRHNRGGYGSDQERDHWGRGKDGSSSSKILPEPQSEPDDTSLHMQKRSNSNNSNSKNGGDVAGSQYTENMHDSQQLQHQQPSPLVLHSQNMWSANLDVVKSARKHTDYHSNHQHHQYHHHQLQQYRKHKDKGNVFNHYEVGCFLLEGKCIGYPYARTYSVMLLWRLENLLVAILKSVTLNMIHISPPPNVLSMKYKLTRSLG